MTRKIIILFSVVFFSLSALIITFSLVKASPQCTVNDDVIIGANFGLDLDNQGAICQVRTSGLATGANAAVASAQCLGGEIAVSGGCYCGEDANPTEAVLRYLQPWIMVGGSPTAWGCNCQRISGSGTVEARAYAVCCF